MRRVSVVLPNLNSIKHLSKAIDAFLAQDYPAKRLIIVDGKSTDGSHDIIKEYSEIHSEIIWLKQQDIGISNAINIALDLVEDSDIWGYLGSDDILLPYVLSKVASIFAIEKTTHGVYFDSYTLHTKDSSVQLRRCPDVPFSVPSLVSYGTIVGLQNIYIDAAIVKKFRFNENAKYSMDYELYLRLVTNGHKMFFHVPEPSSINIQDGNISQVFAKKARAEALGYASEVTGLSFNLFRRYAEHYVSNCVRSILSRVI